MDESSQSSKERPTNPIYQETIPMPSNAGDKYTTTHLSIHVGRILKNMYNITDVTYVAHREPDSASPYVWKATDGVSRYIAYAVVENDKKSARITVEKY